MPVDIRPVFSKNVNIAFACFSSSLGGLELSMLRLALEFERRGANCLVIVPPKSPLSDYASKNRIRTELLKPRWKYGDITASIQLQRILKRNNVDVITAMQSKDINIIAMAHIFNPSVKLVFYQEMQSRINKRDVFHTWMYSKLSLWITLTARMKQEVIENTHMMPERISVVPIGTDMHRFDPCLFDRNEMRDRFAIPRNKFVIGVLGRLDLQKGQEEFIRAVPALVTHKDNLHFVIAGNESPGQEGIKSRLIELSSSLGIADHLQFLPFTNAVPEFISALDIFVLPSYSETFGFVLVEAMAMQKAIVATNSGGVPEIIKDGATGLLVPPRDTFAIGQALLRLIDDENLRLSLSSKARTDALSRFDMEDTVDKLVIAYNDI